MWSRSVLVTVASVAGAAGASKRSKTRKKEHEALKGYLRDGSIHRLFLKKNRNVTRNRAANEAKKSKIN